MSDRDQDELRQEASVIHRAAFGREIPEEVARRYAAAHRRSILRMDASQRAWMRRAVETGADLEALELGLRARQPGHILCTKFRLLIYVAEAFPQYYRDFVNEEPRRLRAWCALAVLGVRSLAKRARGWYLLQRLS